jgi:rhodanese-related sulfurtransferase
MKKMVIASVILSVMAFGYDEQKAKTMESFFQPFTNDVCAKSDMFLDGVDSFNRVKKGEAIFLDVRTLEEKSHIMMPKAINIPLNELFHKENLAKLPKDKKIIVVCHSGLRATMAATSLKIIGIKNVSVVMGGIGELSKVIFPKTLQ